METTKNSGSECVPVRFEKLADYHINVGGKMVPVTFEQYLKHMASLVKDRTENAVSK